MSNQSFFSFQMPDFAAVRDVISKNMQVMSGANQMAVEFAQAAARRGAEASQKNTHKAFETARDAFASRSIEELHKIQNQYASHVIENSCNQAKEMMEVGAKAAIEMIDMFKGMGQCSPCQQAKKSESK